MNRDRKTKFTLRKTTSSSVLLNSSRTGAIILQGPHLKFCSKSTQSQCGTIATRWQKSQPPPASPQQLWPGIVFQTTINMIGMIPICISISQKLLKNQPGSWNHQCQWQRAPCSSCRGLCKLIHNQKPSLLLNQSQSSKATRTLTNCGQLNTHTMSTPVETDDKTFTC